MPVKRFLKYLYRRFRKKRVADIGIWVNDERMRVAIQCTDYFAKGKWLKNIRNTFPEVEQYWQVKFYISSYEREVLAPGLDVIFTFWLNQPFIDLSKRLKWAFIAQSGIEFLENKDFDFDVKTVCGFSSRAIAEYVLCNSLLLLRKIGHACRKQVRQKWDQVYFLQRRLDLLSTKTIGILGFGNNGRATAEVFKKIGCCVLAYDEQDIRAPDIDALYRSGQIDDIIRKSDILVICLPLTSKTENLIGRRQLELLGSDGVLVNVARAEIVNESELIYALQNNVIAGAALDVFKVEPLPSTSRLWNCPNIIITPHIAGNINYFIDDIQIAFLEELRKCTKKRVKYDV
jgi:phosphoglycerate dehydrogenase-like enzyme